MSLGDAASIASALGLVVAVWQLWLGRQQAKTEFEDSIGSQYRMILQGIPVAALMGETVALDDPAVLGACYRYVDLCNEQVFLRSERRIRRDTWRNWVDGIQSNLARPTFRAAWERIKAKCGDSFEELRRLEREGFRTDPVRW